MASLDWKLIVRLSLFGLGMAIATVFWIPSSIEPVFWLAIFLFCAYTIAKRCQSKFFLHGFFVSIVNCVWVTGAHLTFASIYLANHPQEVAMSASMPLANHPRLMMAITGPFIGIVSGVILGLFALVASKIVRRSNPAA
jgi:uncharacterized membrane protein